MSGSSVGTVERVVHLMRVLAEGGGDMTIKAISEALDLPPSTVHRLLTLLMGQQIVSRGESARSYRIGSEFYRLGALVVSALSVRDVARPILERVTKASGEVCLLMRYMPGKYSVMLEDSVDSTHPLRYALNLYEPLSVLWGATGRSVLAFLPQDEVAAVLANCGKSPVSDRKPPSIEDLHKDLAEIRAKGYAKTFGQKIPGAVGFGAPLFDRSGCVFGSLCVTIPQLRYQDTQEPFIADLLCREAKTLSAALGYRGLGGAVQQRAGANG